MRMGLDLYFRRQTTLPNPIVANTMSDANFFFASGLILATFSRVAILCFSLSFNKWEDRMRLVGALVSSSPPCQSLLYLGIDSPILNQICG